MKDCSVFETIITLSEDLGRIASNLVDMVIPLFFVVLFGSAAIIAVAATIFVVIDMFSWCCLGGV